MVFLSLSHYANKRVSPTLLKYGLTLSHNLQKSLPKLHPRIADTACLIPISQKLISLEVYDDYRRQTKPPSKFDAFVEWSWKKLFPHDKDDDVPPAENPNLRLDLLQHYVIEKKVLFPSGKWKDCFRWKDNTYFLMWLRREFLLAKYYRAEHARTLLKNYPQLNARKAVRKLPPSSTILHKAFGTWTWSRKIDFDASYTHMRQLVSKVGGKVKDPRYGPAIDGDFDVSHLSLQDVLEMMGGQVYDCGLFNLFCEELDLYELWTKEYIEGLAAYLLERSRMYKGKKMVILEVGAGDGMLSLFLREVFPSVARKRGNSLAVDSVWKKKKGGVDTSTTIPEVIATDDGSWKIKPVGNVENLHVEQALSKYGNPEDIQLIVICSWMPMGEDWTYLFRKTGVYEYILIGEADYGNCGHNWYTWGNPDYNHQNEKTEANEGNDVDTVIPPYQADGFQRVNLDDLSELQYARFDTSKSRCSSTVSFRNTNNL